MTIAKVTTITRMIVSGATEQALRAPVAQAYPELTSGELLQALQVATAAAEREVQHPH
jgi:hypothetical protein